MTGDANSDSRMDVYLLDEQNGSVCLHLANSTGFAPFTNISLTSPGSLGDVYVDDIDADGYSDLIYSTSSTVGDGLCFRIASYLTSFKWRIIMSADLPGAVYSFLSGCGIPTTHCNRKLCTPAHAAVTGSSDL